MDDQQLMVLLTVAEKRNFTRAAEALHMTQPAVSQHVQSLERALGAKLFDRNNKAVYLTKAGEIALHYARDILGMYGRMQQLVDDLTQSPKGAITIGASYTYGEYLLPYLIAKFRKQYPAITPTIFIANTSDVAAKVANHQLDIGIIEGDLTHADLRIQAFAEDTMAVVIPAQHRLADCVQVRVETLQGETWILREFGSGTRAVQDRVIADLGITVQGSMEFGSTQVIKESVEAGLGLSILSEAALRKELALNTLKTLEIDHYPIRRNFSVVTLASPFQTKAMELFVAFLRESGVGVSLTAD